MRRVRQVRQVRRVRLGRCESTRMKTAARAGSSREPRCRSRATGARSCCRASRIAWRCASTRSRPRLAASWCPLVDVGAGAAADFEGKDVKGAVVLGNAAVGGLWTRAVRERGAAGRDLDRPRRVYTARCDAGRSAVGQHPVRRDAAVRSASRPRRAPRVRLREALAAGPVRLHVEIATTFHRGPNRTLVAEIPGTAAKW